MKSSNQRSMRNLSLCVAVLTGGMAFAGENAAPDWVLETEAAGWQARDSQGEVVFGDRMWIMGGWFNSHEAPPRDVWSSADGRAWELVAESAPWIHSDLSMSIVFNDRMWMMGGWYNGRLPGHSASNQVKTWERLETKTCWKARHEHSAFVFRDKLWIAGGHARPLNSEVWSLQLPANWGNR